jgi:hypothetical protein
MLSGFGWLFQIAWRAPLLPAGATAGPIIESYNRSKGGLN